MLSTPRPVHIAVTVPQCTNTGAVYAELFPASSARVHLCTECIVFIRKFVPYCRFLGSCWHLPWVMFGTYPVRTLLCSLCNESVLKPETDRQTSYITYRNGKLTTSKPKPNTFPRLPWNLTRCHVHNSPQLDLYLEPQTIQYVTLPFFLYIHLNIIHPINLSLPSGFLATFEDPCVVPQACYIPPHLLSSVCLQKTTIRL